MRQNKNHLMKHHFFFFFVKLALYSNKFCQIVTLFICSIKFLIYSNQLFYSYQITNQYHSIFSYGLIIYLYKIQYLLSQHMFVPFCFIMTLFSFIIIPMGLYEVREGYVGVYKDLGVLQKNLAEPGLHFAAPFFRKLTQVSVSIKTDIVYNIPCGTSNGTTINFEKIEVVNKLKKKYVYETLLNYTQKYQKIWITDKIHHEINKFCSVHSLQEIYIDIFSKLDQQLMKSLKKDLKKWAPGIQIISVRVTKPTIPNKLLKKYERMQKIKVNYFVEVEKQKVQTQEQMTKQKKQIATAEMNLEVKKIELKKMLEKKENEKKMALIEAQMIFEKAKAQIDMQFIAAEQEADLLPSLYNKKYLKYLAADALSSNVNFTVGKKIPKMILKK